MFRAILVYAVVTAALADIGDRCIMSKSRNKIGVCQELANCRHLRGRQTLCDAQNGRHLVCCPPIETTTPTATTITSARVSVQKCRDYAQIIGQECPTAGPVFDGVGNATKGEFPHMAFLGYKRGNDIIWKCTGSLISEDYVLTAAQCTNYSSREEVLFTIRLGGLNYFNTPEIPPTEDVGIGRIYPHPEYSEAYRYNDIALIRLKQRVTLNAFIRPACLPTGFRPAHGRAIVINAIQNGQLADFVSKIHMDPLEHKACVAIFDSALRGLLELRDGIVESVQFCARPVNPNVAVCENVPLQVHHEYHHCTYTIIGISSFGMECNVTGFPDVYTRVSNYLDWIESIVWP